MSCCSNGYCNFEFPLGPPLTDHPVATLSAKYLFLPYGTLLEEGELIRIWTEAGKTKEVFIEHKINLSFDAGYPCAEPPMNDSAMPWSLIAFDSGWQESDILGWGDSPVRNVQSTSVVLVFGQSIEPTLTFKEKLYQLLYKIRNL